jgi:hypothetical protein
MVPWHWAAILKPLGVLIFLGLIVLPVKMALDRCWRDGPVKRFLFKKRW